MPGADVDQPRKDCFDGRCGYSVWWPALLLNLASAILGDALAIEFSAAGGEFSGSFDTTLTVGAALRVQDRDQDIIGRANGGFANSVNFDDGNLNFDQGDITSLAAQATHELQLDWRNLGFFGRIFYFYDAAIMDLEPERTDFTDQAKDRAGRDIELLDAFVSGDFAVAERPLTLRLGNQVLSWGESTFIPNGINIINPLDVTRLRVAGAEIRDALVPVPIVDASLGLTDNLSIEAFYQFDYEQTELEPAGTFFSTNDLVSPGASRAFLGFGAIPDILPLPPGTNSPIGPFLPRAGDEDPDDQGQFGIALRYFAEELNETEFGLYYVRHHSRLPLVSIETGTPAGLAAGDYASTARYFAEFPEDIDLLGASFNTTVGTTGLALQGEASYRFNQPLQVDDVELLFAVLSPIDAVSETPIFGLNQLGTFGFAEEIKGFRREGVFQAQITGTQLFGPTFGADQLALVGEIGATWIPGLPDKDKLRFNAPGTFTSGNPIFTQAGIQPETTTDGFGDDFSWGYRIRARADFLGAIGPVNLFPQVAFSHDVHGTTPDPLGTFVEGRKAVTLALAASYLASLQGELAYTTFFGGGDANLVNDRDFVSLTISYSF